MRVEIIERRKFGKKLFGVTLQDDDGHSIVADPGSTLIGADGTIFTVAPGKPEHKGWTLLRSTIFPVKDWADLQGGRT